MTKRFFFYFCLPFIFTILSNDTLNAQTAALRDPTQPAITDIVTTDKKGVVKEDKLILQSIFISPTRKLAVIKVIKADDTRKESDINPNFVKVGDTLGKSKIKGITNNSVVLSQPGRTITIYIFKKPHLE